ncbi:HAMP domain-containing protein [Sphaerisporangium album]|uniref:histidine kinase n=1 Tax=Sphaerisporangium album TaxID=509200 RepID=A0A367FN75_9ACTN|nr:histidine kinase [Sphaerisporangium album]RCG31711.1 HAMP domain-containing protein [Sphaerisporangium album]
MSARTDPDTVVRPPAGEPAGAVPSRRAPAKALFWRIFAINGVVFTAATFVLALSPATVSTPVHLAELPVLAVGLVAILTANAVLLRRSLAPLQALTGLMERVDVLRPSGRLRFSGNGDLAGVIAAFNAMLDRLEAERGTAAAHALAAQEGERRRIARELHDEIGQSLTVVLLGLKRAADRAPSDLREELRTITETVRASLDEVGQVARRLRPGVLEDLGLTSALSALAIEISQLRGVSVTRHLDARLPPLSEQAELVLYRIAQEALTNIARHADARHVAITLGRDGDSVVLAVGDDGRGGPIAEGAGIRGMRERALLVGARLDITHPYAGGTTVRLTVPTGTEGR